MSKSGFLNFPSEKNGTFHFLSRNFDFNHLCHKSECKKILLSNWDYFWEKKTVHQNIKVSLKKFYEAPKFWFQSKNGGKRLKLKKKILSLLLQLFVLSFVFDGGKKTGRLTAT